MANKTKNTVDYFPFFVSDGRTLFILKKELGVQGIGLFTELFRFLSRTPDHYFCIQNDYDRARLVDFIGCSEDELLYFLNILHDTNKIDSELWMKKRVIVSEDFMESLTEAYRKRSNSPLSIEDIREVCKSIPDIDLDTTGNMAETLRNAAGKEKKIKEEKRKENRFTPPSVEEVKEYLTEKNITTIDPERFVAFYDSKGWMVGKNKMTSWKSSITTWKKNQFPQSSSQGVTYQPTQYKPRFHFDSEDSQ